MKAESAGSAPVALSDPKQWVELHGDYLFRYALIRVRNSAVAEDVVQETLLAAFQARDRFSAADASERGWLTGILRHKILDHFRQLKREQTLSPAELLPPELEDRFDDVGVWKHEPALGPRDWGEDAPTLIQRQEFMAALRECLERLPARTADAFVLREMEGTASERIQELLGISASNFWVLLHRARMQLRLCLEQNWLKL
jgi:RNA polymerase sigma-70 factor (TIGR02943 family)